MKIGNSLTGNQLEAIKTVLDKEAKKGTMAFHSKEEIAESTRRGDSLIAFSDSRPIGFISLIHWRNYVEIGALVVEENFRRRGIGEKLFEKILELAIEKYPRKQTIVLSNEISSAIARKHDFLEKSKEEVDSELWSLCDGCQEFSIFPNCHCRLAICQQPRVFELNQGDCFWLKKVADLYCKVWRETPWDEYFWQPDMVVENLEECFRGKLPIVLVTVVGDRIPGFSWGSVVSDKELEKISSGAELQGVFNGKREVFYVEELAIDSKMRNRGIGTLLSGKLIEKAKAFDAQIKICLRTDKKAIAARKLYKKLEFRDLGICDKKHSSRTYWLL